MTRYITWTKVILETFIEESGLKERIELGDDKAFLMGGILRTLVANWSVVKQAQEFNVSIDTVNYYRAELKKLYMETQKHSLILPPVERTPWNVRKKKSK